jgi:chromosome segregation ATPase
MKPATINNQENAVPNNRAISPAVVSEKITHHNVDTEKYLTEIAGLRQSLEESHKAYADMKQDFEGLEKERDFYFEKLRDVEIVLQDLEDKGQSNELSAAIFKILYATAEGFEPVNDEGASGSNIPATPHKGAFQEEVVANDTY